MSCASPTLSAESISRAEGNEITALFTMRYRLASDPDVDGSYTTVMDTKEMFGVTFPYFDITVVDAGDYVVHTYLTASGSSTGTKITITVGCDDPV